MFVTESHKKFHKETNPRDSFYGQMGLMKISRRDNLYVAKLSFDLNEGASVGGTFFSFEEVALPSWMEDGNN